MEKLFFDEAAEARAELVEAINAQQWDNNLRTKAETLLILYDQMTELLKAQKQTLERAYKAGYKRRAEMSDRTYDELSELCAGDNFAEWFISNLKTS